MTGYYILGSIALAKQAKKKTAKKTGFKKSLCVKCTGKCCRYIALPIETPETWDEFDDVRWYLLHKGVGVFVEDGDWYFQVDTDCSKLSEKDYKCHYYDRRPKICREYQDDTCDLTSDDYGYELHFTSPEQMEEYMKLKFGAKIIEKIGQKDRE